FYGRIMANWRDNSGYNSSYTSTMYWDFGYFEWTMNPALKVAIGRQMITGAQDLFWTNGGYDAIQFKFGAPSDKFQAKVGYGDVGTYVSANEPAAVYATKPLILVDANYQFSKDWAGNAAMYWSTNADKTTALTTTGTGVNGYPFQVYNLGMTGQLNQDFKVKANYFWNVAQIVKDTYNNDNANGWAAELWFRGADKAKVGSWGLSVNYRDLKPFAYDLANASGIFGNSVTSGSTIAYGQKGWGVQANYTISKNAVLTATYEKLSYNSSMLSSDMLPYYYVQLNVNF
ncbi:hypothetical protein JZU71_00030, partial [bacterium]|nr:hypothetical protein [bacterium]